MSCPILHTLISLSKQEKGSLPIQTQTSDQKFKHMEQVLIETRDFKSAKDCKQRKPYQITKQRQKWKVEEHEKFLQGLELYGRAWRQITEYVGTKTIVQIRSHAQKFFNKLPIPLPGRKSRPNHPKHPRTVADEKKQCKKMMSSSSSSSSSSIKLFGITMSTFSASLSSSPDHGDHLETDMPLLNLLV